MESPLINFAEIGRLDVLELFTGTLGCLVQARRQGLLPAIRPLLDELRIKARFWISDTLAARVLHDAGEA